MVRPSKRSHSEARIKTRLPGNIMRIHYIRRRPKHAHCPVTNVKLHGVPRLRPAQLGKLGKTQRRPNRPYGGRISHKALSNAIQAKVLEQFSKQ
ncbi:50S ribosomal protein L34e [Promethearchaeum syntrophicum]|uniref:Large ribosomal subunit protein eL34 n=1 Tax=Promethearchaeum syntrophicum TaxID=2594042 RepID=A0A5B9D5B3_9ARCH|nr:50S ribosomal protein L34e [Candidatus Prometheoarchaeum syntrophicum]QEE14299.1 50S ribosomal protein L34e [Candidatus Prometheoarchaeum syntrophicum]